MTAKRAAWGLPFLAPVHLDRLRWLRTHLDDIEAALGEALH
jgi:hypothetical protein